MLDQEARSRPGQGLPLTALLWLKLPCIHEGFEKRHELGWHCAGPVCRGQASISRGLIDAVRLCPRWRRSGGAPTGSLGSHAKPQHFPDSKTPVHPVTSPGWQVPTCRSYTLLSPRMNPKLTHCLAASFNPPVGHMMIDPLLLGAGEGYAQPIPTPIVRNEQLMYAMNDLHLVQEQQNTPVSVPPEYSNMGFPMQFAPVRQTSPHSYGSNDTGSPQSGVSASSSHPGILPCKYPVLKPWSRRPSPLPSPRAPSQSEGPPPPSSEESVAPATTATACEPDATARCPARAVLVRRHAPPHP